MDVAALRERLTTAYRTRRDQAKDLVDGLPVVGRMVSGFVRIEFIDRCMLIAAQGLLALIPMLVVLTAFLPHLTGDAVRSFSDAAGVGGPGTEIIEGQVSTDQVRTQTGLIGLAITIVSASSFARAIQRMYERVWERPHVGGVSGVRRCLVWLIGWLVSLQIVGGLRRVTDGVGGIAGSGAGLLVQALMLSLIWWATSWLLLFGRVSWHDLALGAVLTGVIGVVYNRGSSWVMPPYVEANAEQFGTLGVILAISTWLIGFAGILVGAALVGRVVSEDPTVRRAVRSTAAALRELRGPAQPQTRPESEDAKAAQREAG